MTAAMPPAVDATMVMFINPTPLQEEGVDVDVEEESEAETETEVETEVETEESKRGTTDAKDEEGFSLLTC